MRSLDNFGNSVLSSQTKCRLYAACACFAVEAGNSWSSTYLTLRRMWAGLPKKSGRTMIAVFLSEAKPHTNSASWTISNYLQIKVCSIFLKTASIRTPKSCTPDLLARACKKLQTGSLEEDLTISTLRDGYISPSPVEMTSQRQDLATSSYSKQAPATITANPVSVACLFVCLVLNDASTLVGH